MGGHAQCADTTGRGRAGKYICKHEVGHGQCVRLLEQVCASTARHAGNARGFLTITAMLSLWGAERAFLLRRQLSKLHRPGQFAALVAGTGRKIAVTDAARMLAATEMFPHELSSLLMGEALRPDVPTP